MLFRGGSGCLIAFGMQTGNEKPYCDKLNADLEKEHANYPAGVPIVMVGRTSEYVHGGLPTSAKPTFHFGKPVEQFSAEFLEQFRERYVTTMCDIAEHRPVYIVRPTPEMGVDVPTLIGRAMLLGRERNFSLSLTEYHERHAFVWSVQDEAVKRCGVHVLDPLAYLCSGEKCPSAEGNRPLYRDTDHFTESGNRVLVPMFRTIFLH